MDIDGIKPAPKRRVARSLDGVNPAIVPKVTPKVKARPIAAPMGPVKFRPKLTPIPTQELVPSPGPEPAPSSKPPKLLASQPETTPPADQAVLPDHLDMPDYVPPKHSKRAKWKRWSTRAIVWRSLAVLVLLVLSVGGFLTWRAYDNLHKVFRGTSTIAALNKKALVPEELETEGDSRVNILLLGIGGPGHQGPDLTDTIVIMSVDPVNKTATMVSVPRDLWVDMPVNYFGKQQKINAAYESGKYHYVGRLDSSNANAKAVEAGFDSIDKAIKDTFDVRIDYHALVNFYAFKQAVDTVGGITVNVPTRLYDPTMAWENHWNPVLAEAGMQHMDGTKALLYARSRETTSDFARAERQRQILLALKDKALSLGTLGNPAKIDGLMSAFGNNVYSDLSTQGAYKLYDIMKETDDADVLSVGLTDKDLKLVTTDRIGTTSVVRPVAGFGVYGDIQTFVRSKLPDGYLVRERASIMVVGNTAAGATATANLLKSYGYNVVGTSVATEPTQKPAVIDRTNGLSPYTRNYLERRFDAKATTKLPASVSPTAPAAKFVIMVAK